MRRVYDLRQKGDYAIGLKVSEGETKEVLESARRYVAERDFSKVADRSHNAAKITES